MLQVCFTLFNLQGTQFLSFQCYPDDLFILAHSVLLVKLFFQDFLFRSVSCFPPDLSAVFKILTSHSHLFQGFLTVFQNFSFIWVLRYFITLYRACQALFWFSFGFLKYPIFSSNQPEILSFPVVFKVFCAVLTCSPERSVRIPRLSPNVNTYFSLFSSFFRFVYTHPCGKCGQVCRFCG